MKQLAEIEQQLLTGPLFSALEREDLRRLLESAEILSLALGQAVATAESAFLVVLSGRVRVLTTREGREMVLTTLQPGDSFGEEALLGETPAGTTLRAAQDSTLLKIPGPALEELLSQRSELRSYFQRYLKDLSIRSFLKVSTILTSLTGRELKSVLAHLQEVDCAAGEDVFRQGDPGDSFYIVRSGRLEVVRQSSGRAVALRELKPGDFFGELALLYGGSRTAGVRSLEASRLFRLSRADFEELFSTRPEVKARILDSISHYQLEDGLRAQWGLKEGARPQEFTPLPPPPGQLPPPPRPPRRLFGRYPYLRQFDETDCGAACLGMILRYWGCRVGLGRLRDLANVSREGASLLSLCEAAERLGFCSSGLRLGYDHLPGQPLPLIAHWEGNHYIVVYEATREHVLVADPGTGMRRMTPEEFQQGWTGYALQLTPGPSLARSERKRPGWKRIAPLVAPFRGLLAEILLASLALDLLGLAAPVFTQTLVDRVLVQKSASLLHLMAAGMLVVIASSTVVTGIRRYLLAHVSNRLDLSLVITLYRHLLGLPVEYFERRKIGDFVSRFSDTYRIRQLITGTAVTTILDTLMVGVYLAAMAYYNLTLTGAVLAFVPLFAGLTLAATPWLKRLNRETLGRQGLSESALIETVAGIHTVKASALELGMRWKWEDLYHKVLRAGMRSQVARLVVDSAGSLLNRVALLAVLYLGALQVLGGRLTVGQLMAFNLLAGCVIGPIARLIGLWDDLQESAVSLERVHDVLDSQLEQVGPHPAPVLRGHIQLDQVAFRYGTRADRYVLQGIQLDLPPGQTVALVGRSGSGKTTLARLLMGVLRPTEGRILIDGQDLTGLDLTAYRRQLGVVLQESVLFSGTVRENIALGDPDPDPEQVYRAAVAANAHDFISTLPEGYETRLRERGTNLSGGQRQRLAIARALYGDPRVLILDEATSHLDLESEKAIQANLRQLLAGRTAIVIAHRLSTVYEADLILVLDFGRVVERGTHASLMAQKGLYYYLNTQQLRQ